MTSPHRSRSSSERRLRIGFALTSLTVAGALCLSLAAFAASRGEPPSSLAPVFTGIALGLLAEMLCLDVAVRRVGARLRALPAASPHRDGERSVALGLR